MKQSELNHLRLLLGWVRTEIGQTPEELVATMQDIADKLGHPPISDEARQRLVLAHDRARDVPKYVRAAVKALEPLTRPGEAVPGLVREVRKLEAAASLQDHQENRDV